MRNAVAVVLFVALAGAGVVAGAPEKGEKEVSFRVSYSDTDLGVSQGFDLGSVEDTEATLAYGFLVTDRHEFGGTLGYVRQKIEGGDLGPDESFDGTSIGGFYNFNIKVSGPITPYVGVAVSKLSGDQGDVYDLLTTVEVGIKVYPWDHAGFSVGLGRFELEADGPFPDADGTTLGAGVLIKY